MINYQILEDSINYYSSLGFKRIESPWTVSQYVDDITRPVDAVPYELKHNNKRLVASGEQSFLYLYLKNFIPEGQYQTITPCFRSDSFDYTHTKYFIKNEIIKTDVVNEEELINIVYVAYNFFKKYIPDLKIIETDIGYDINYNEYELGSYGIRKSNFLKWIYATGCAEPRLSRIISVFNDRNK